MRHDLPAGPVIILLLEAYPLIRLVRGEKRLRLQQAWIAAADSAACASLATAHGTLPQGPRAAAEDLLRSAIQVARDQGITGPDLSSFFNDTMDAGALARSPDPDDTLLATHALLALMAARRLQARDPIAGSCVA